MLGLSDSFLARLFESRTLHSWLSVRRLVRMWPQMWPQMWCLTKEWCAVMDATREPAVEWAEADVLHAVVKLVELSARQLERREWSARIEKAEAGAFVDAENIALQRQRLAAGAKQASRDETELKKLSEHVLKKTASLDAKRAERPIEFSDKPTDRRALSLRDIASAERFDSLVEAVICLREVTDSDLWVEKLHPRLRDIYPQLKKGDVKSAVADATFDLGPAGCWVAALGGPVSATKTVLRYLQEGGKFKDFEKVQLVSGRVERTPGATRPVDLIDPQTLLPVAPHKMVDLLLRGLGYDDEARRKVSELIGGLPTRPPPR